MWLMSVIHTVLVTKTKLNVLVYFLEHLREIKVLAKLRSIEIENNQVI